MVGGVAGVAALGGAGAVAEYGWEVAEDCGAGEGEGKGGGVRWERMG